MENIRIWKENRGGDPVKRYGESPELTLLDSRLGRKLLYYPLNGLQREIYDFRHEIRSHANIAEFASKKFDGKVAVDGFPDQLVDSRLMLREGNQYLSLAVDTSRGPSSD